MTLMTGFKAVAMIDRFMAACSRLKCIVGKPENIIDSSRLSQPTRQRLDAAWLPRWRNCCLLIIAYELLHKHCYPGSP